MTYNVKIEISRSDDAGVLVMKLDDIRAEDAEVPGYFLYHAIMYYLAQFGGRVNT